MSREESLRRADKVPDNREVDIIGKWKEVDTVHVSDSPGGRCEGVSASGSAGEGEDP